MKRAFFVTIVFIAAIFATIPCAADLRLRLGPEQLVKADGVDIDVPGYSVPSTADWNNDGLMDLIVGEGMYPTGKVRIYINEGTESQPLFDTYLYAQSGGSDLTCPGSGCMGCFPRVVYWNDDAVKDLLIGQADGRVKIFRGIGDDTAPTFDAGTLLQVGPAGSKTDIDVGIRATPSVVDWNNDGIRDLVVGAKPANIFLYINEGTDTEPDYRSQQLVKENGANLLVPSDRSSPVVMDLDDDGKKDILTGNTNGQLLFYRNKGTDSDPNFAGYELVESDGVVIDLAGSPRSRPFVCDWTEDGYPDVLIGASDGNIHLYQSIPQPGDADKDYDVDFKDLAIVANQYGAENCGKCAGADIEEDNEINMLDILKLAQNWLQGCK